MSKASCSRQCPCLSCPKTCGGRRPHVARRANQDPCQPNGFGIAAVNNSTALSHACSTPHDDKWVRCRVSMVFSARLSKRWICISILARIHRRRVPFLRYHIAINRNLSTYCACDKEAQCYVSSKARKKTPSLRLLRPTIAVPACSITFFRPWCRVACRCFLPSAGR